jgi:methylthioribose-1-phosphate isomerase
MSRRRLRRRQFDRSARGRLVDEAFACYLDWLTESEAVKAAYEMWSRSAPAAGAVPFAAYGAALDREEWAAAAYCSLIEQMKQLLGGKERPVGARPLGHSRA